MKKFLNVLSVILLSAFIVAGCSNVAEYETDTSVIRAANKESVTISSDLNPGFGKAVYFTGTFYQGKDWNVAVRGTYVDGKWVCNVSSNKESFEYKALIGDWDLGENVKAEYPQLTKLGKADHLPGYQGMPSGYFVYSAENINYGDAVYFVYDGYQYPYAIRGTYREKYLIGYCPTVYNVWSLDNVELHFYATVTAYVGSYDLGETLNPTFINLTWEDGENHIYSVN